MTYDEITVREIEAEQYVGSTLRGGYVFQGKFYFHASSNVGMQVVDAKDYKATVDINSGNGRLA